MEYFNVTLEPLNMTVHVKTNIKVCIIFLNNDITYTDYQVYVGKKSRLTNYSTIYTWIKLNAGTF